MIYRELGELRKSLNDLNSAFESSPNDYVITRERGITRKQMGDFSEALTDFDHSILMNPNDEISFQQRGIVHRILGKYNLSLQDLNISIRLLPVDHLTYRERALTRLLMGNVQKAVQDIEKSLQFRSNSKKTMELKRIVMEKLKDAQMRRRNSTLISLAQNQKEEQIGKHNSEINVDFEFSDVELDLETVQEIVLFHDNLQD